MCMNRTYDLKVTMPTWLAEAAENPPVEICVLNYQSTDDMDDYIHSLDIPDGVSFIYRRYTGKQKTYHMAHSMNLTVLASHGEYFSILGADAILYPGYMKIIRKLIDEGYLWMSALRKQGCITCQRQAFIDAGGFDERFEFYGPEDKDFKYRMLRRGNKCGWIPKGFIDSIETPKSQKGINYRGRPNWRQMAEMMHPIYRENLKAKTLVANEGKEWGSWE